MNNHPWDLADSVKTLNDILAAARPCAGDVVIARVELSTQEISGFRRLAGPTPPLPLNDTEASYRARQSRSDRLAEIANELGSASTRAGAGWRVPAGVLVTVVCRTGRAVTTANEWQWALAWRYANHVTDAYNGDIYALTPHGWVSMEGGAGLRPTLDEIPRPALKVVS